MPLGEAGFTLELAPAMLDPYSHTGVTGLMCKGCVAGYHCWPWSRYCPPPVRRRR